MDTPYHVEYRPARYRMRYLTYRLPILREITAVLSLHGMEKTVFGMIDDFKKGRLERSEFTLHFSRLTIMVAKSIERRIGRILFRFYRGRINKLIDATYELERLVRKDFFKDPANRRSDSSLAEAVVLKNKQALQRIYAKG